MRYLVELEVPYSFLSYVESNLLANEVYLVGEANIEGETKVLVETDLGVGEIEEIIDIVRVIARDDSKRGLSKL